MIRTRWGAAGAIVLAWMACMAGSPARAATLPSGFQDSVAFDGLEEPTAVEFSPDGRIFVAEKAGKILIFDGFEDETAAVFDDLRTEVYDSGDRGLLGLALDPEFPERPYVYALFTYDHVLGEPGGAPEWGEPDHSGDACSKPPDADVDACPVSGRIVRITASGGEAVGDQVLVENWCQQNSSHSIGDLQFGPEGALFASGGDGASFIDSDYGQYGWPQTNQCGDPPGGVGEALKVPDAEGGSLRSQDVLTPEGVGGADPTSLDGSVIRIDPDSGEGLPGNPFASSLDANARRIVAFGFRNPFRFAVNAATDEVYVANVGNGTDEEIDRFATIPGQAYNSGWPCYEGTAKNPGFQYLGLDLCEGLYDAPASVSDPFFYYHHAAGVVPDDPCPRYNGSAISGLSFYDGGSFPSDYDGALFFADSVRGCIYVMRADDDGWPDPLSAVPFLTDAGAYPGIDIEVGPGGDLFYTSLVDEEWGPYSGSIHRISYDPGAPVARLSADQTWGAVPLEVKFDAGASSDPDGEALEYEWDLDGDGSFETEGGDERTATFPSAVNATISVRVDDPGPGPGSVARVTVYPGDSPPQITIDGPLESQTWEVGQAIEFTGSAEEGDGDPLGEYRLYWKTRLYHCPGGAESCHAHPLQAFPATGSGTLVAPDHDYPAKIELTLTATDERGLSASQSVTIHPRSVELGVDSEPGGVTLTAGLLTQPGPLTVTAIEGSHISLSAPETAQIGGETYLWGGWSDGGARVHSIVADAPAQYTATYEVAPSLPDPPAEDPFVEPPRPETHVVRRPPRRTRKTTARFAFAADQADAWFQCKLDQGEFKPCRSPRVYRHLRPGGHLLEIRALTPAGKEDMTPVVLRWRVLKARG